MEWKNCPRYGARMPKEAAFCPHCARSVNGRKEVHPPRRLSRRAVRISLAVLAALSLILAAWLYTRPRTYDDGGTATVIYTDQDGSYQLVLGWFNAPASRGMLMHTKVGSTLPTPPPRRSIRRRSWTGSTVFPCACSSTIQAATPTRPIPL